jgi:NitT/TauT family transport system substrate-binding protein
MKFTRRKLLAAGALTGIVAPFAGHAQSLPLIRFAGAAPVPRADHAWMNLGIPMGYYEKLGFRGDYLPTAGSAAAVQLVLSGAAEVANSGFLELIAMKQRQPNLPVHMFYSQERSSSYQIIVMPDSPVRSVADLKGKVIGVPSLASGAVPFARGMLKREKVDPKNVTFIAIGVGPQALASLRSKQVDAISIFLGSIAAMESMGQQFRYFSAKIAGAGMVMRSDFVMKNRDLATRIFQGLVLNQRIMLMNPDAVVRAFFKQYGQPPGDAEQNLRNNAHLVKRTAEVFQQPSDNLPWGLYTEQEWINIREFFAGDESLIPANAKLSDYFDGSLVEAGNRIDLKMAEDAIRPFAG